MTKNKIITISLVVVILSVVMYALRSKQSPATNTEVSNKISDIVPKEQLDSLTKSANLINFSSSVEKSQSGNFVFQYPSIFTVREDSLSKDFSGQERHFVILSARDGFDFKDVIEINMPDKTCADYSTCKEVVGVVTSTTASKEIGRVFIGTNSSDPDFLNWFDVVANTFRVFPQIPSGPPPTR